MTDSGDVARWLLQQWLPAGTLSWATDNDWSPTFVEAVAVFLGAAHDIGKVTIPFARAAPSLHAQMQKSGLVGRSAASGPPCHHTRTGHHLMVEYLTGSKGFSSSDATSWGVVIAGHHGAVPSNQELNMVRPHAQPDVYGRDAAPEVWRGVVTALLDECWTASGLDEIPLPNNRHLPLAGQVVIGGLVIMADWIASNEKLFPLGDARPGRADDGLAALGLPRTWRPAPPPRDIQAHFAARFDLFAEVAPRPVQRDAVVAARWLGGPGLLVIEAAPGEGKTEAAHVAAEVLAQQCDLGGLFIALPTQATTDAMFTRVLTWLGKLGEDELPVGSTLWLGHGRRALNRDFDGLQRIRLGDIRDQDECRAHRVAAHEWLTHKKSLLATTVVGTIDQLLLAALPLKHNALRFLGLAGKVVVIDEAHAYDPFMRTHLGLLLRWLAELRVPVVLLSATLPSAIRAELVEAYARRPVVLEPNAGYPRITAVSTADVRTWTPDASGRGAEVDLETVSDDIDAISQRCRDLLKDGGCALIVRNTVAAARETATGLRERLGWPVECHHARFIAADRAANDARLLDQFGPDARLAERGSQRPARAIIVATQVAEMSLDVDFDLLITDLAPMDAIIQRLGRCHRHVRLRPTTLTRPRCVVITDLDVTVEPRVSSGSIAVYGMTRLLATAVALLPKIDGCIALPEDIVGLVEDGYSPTPALPAAWQTAYQEASQKEEVAESTRRDTASSMEIADPSCLGGRLRSSPPTLIGWRQAGPSEGDETTPAVQAAVRDGRESVEVILLQRLSDGTWQIPERVGGVAQEVDTTVPVQPDQARTMAGCVVRVTPRHRSAHLVRQALMAATPAAWRDDPVLGRWPVIGLDEDGRAEIDGTEWQYNPTEGLEVHW